MTIPSLLYQTRQVILVSFVTLDTSVTEALGIFRQYFKCLSYAVFWPVNCCRGPGRSIPTCNEICRAAKSETLRVVLMGAIDEIEKESGIALYGGHVWPYGHIKYCNGVG